MTTPSGSPPWLRAAGIEDFGGHVAKANYGSVGVVNARTDVGAEAVMALSRDLVALVNTAPFAVIYLTCNDSSPAAPTINIVNLMTGVRATTYAGDAAPAGFPSAARNGNGHVTITFDASYTDAYGVAGDFAIGTHSGSLNGSTAGSVSTDKTSATTLVCRAFDSGGSAISNASMTIEVG